MGRLTITVAPRHRLLTPVLALAILLTACSTPSQMTTLQPPPPPPIPSVGLSPRIIEQARVYVDYGAMLAQQDPTFVAGVRLYVAVPGQRPQVIAELYKNPAYAFGLKGSDSAAGRIIAKVGEAGTQIYAAGRAVKQAAYDVQHQAWSKTDVPDRDERLDRAKSISAAIMMSPRDTVSALRSSDSSITYPVAGPTPPW